MLEKGEKGAGGEIQLTDGMIALAATQAFHGVRFDGSTYDCGSKLGFLTANHRLRPCASRGRRRLAGRNRQAPGLSPERSSRTRRVSNMLNEKAPGPASRGEPRMNAAQAAAGSAALALATISAKACG